MEGKGEGNRKQSNETVSMASTQRLPDGFHISKDLSYCSKIHKLYSIKNACIRISVVTMLVSTRDLKMNNTL